MEISILRRLAKTLGFAVQTLDEDINTSIYIVYVPDTGSPVVTEHKTREAVVARVSELRELQLAEDDPECEHHVFVFQGTRWRMIKGRTWKLYDGKELIDLRPGNIEDQFDDTGSLLEPPPLNDAVPEREPDPVVEEDDPLEDEI